MVFTPVPSAETLIRLWFERQKKAATGWRSL